MDSTSPARPLALSRWLFLIAGLVFCMVVVGGITRLTESGLSITEWKPISGAIPPLTHADWQHAFQLYQRTPEYRQINGPAGMTLAGFKFIFLWEWMHRLLGRIIVFIQLMLGAWVAGLNAGQVASDWPTMQGKLYPDGVDWSQGVLHALTYDPFLIHFMHRWWAWVVVAALVIFARQAKPRDRK